MGGALRKIWGWTWRLLLGALIALLLAPTLVAPFLYRTHNGGPGAGR